MELNQSGVLARARRRLRVRVGERLVRLPLLSVNVMFSRAVGRCFCIIKKAGERGKERVCVCVCV